MIDEIQSIDEALIDPESLGAALGEADSWSPWFVCLRAAFGLPLNDEQKKLFNEVAGDRGLPLKRVREFWAIVGRRGGKSKMAAAIAVYIACFVKHKKLSRGERGMVLVLAMSLDQARVVFDYALEFLQASEQLSKLIKSTTAHEIRLKNGITLATHANSFRSIRGRTLIAAIFDEVAFWRDDTTATPDTETYTAVLPSLLTTNGMLISISSAYRRAGLMYAKHRDYFGQDNPDILVVKGSTTTFNPTVATERLAAMREADPTAAPSEFDSEFRSDLAGFLDDEVVDRAVNELRPLELPPAQYGVFYRAFCDPSGGATGGDAYSFAIGHVDGDKVIIDLVRGVTGPFDPVEITKQYADLCRQYRVGTVVGDNYAKEWCQQAWRGTGIDYVKSEFPASQLYLEMQPFFYRGLIELPPDPILIRELKLLERRPGLLGKEQVSHARGTHDDRANAVAGVVRVLANHLGFDSEYPFGNRPERDESDDPATIKQQQQEESDANFRWRLSNYMRAVGIPFGGWR
jgi:hypothetical protein